MQSLRLNWCLNLLFAHAEHVGKSSPGLDNIHDLQCMECRSASLITFGSVFTVAVKVFCFPCLARPSSRWNSCCRMLSEPRHSDSQGRITKTNGPGSGCTIVSLALLKSYKYTLAHKR